MDLKKNLNALFLNEHSIQKFKDNTFNSLYLLKYKKINDNFEYYNVPAVMQCRGIILEEYTNKIICYSLDKFDKKLDNLEIKDYKVEEAIDGTQIRLYYYNNEWIVSTARTISAKNSKWNYVKTFYDLFKDVEHIIDYSKLNQKNTYTFIMKHIENRIISNVKKNELIHIHTRDNETLLEIEEDIGVPKPKEYHFETFDELLKDLEQFDFETKGYVVKSETKKYMYKTKNYEYVNSLKDNHRNINYHYLDSGAIYRVIALAIHNKKLEFNQEKKIVELLKEIEISFEFDKTFLDGKDVSSEIREESISKLASKIAQNQELRKSLLSFQRSFAKKPGLVAEGRDMTTVVFPGADLKIYLDASVEERSKRRHKQLILKGNNVNIANLVTEITLRDKQDKERVHSPLVIDDEAHIINNDGLSVEETINKILALII